MGRIKEIYDRFSDRAEFFIVYVQEAHPTDGWQVDSNLEDEVLIRQHQSYEERVGAASACSIDLDISLPVLVEEMDNQVDEGYGAAPERLYLIDEQGRVAYHGGAGPHFFDLDEWEEALTACLAVTS